MIPAQSGPRFENECHRRRWPVDLTSLLDRIAQRDEEALESFYAATSRLTYTLALRILRDHQMAEEATADVYLQVWNQARTFEPRRGDPRLWLVTMTRSRAIDRLRSKGFDDSRDRRSAEECLISAPGPAAEYEDVHRALAALPAAQRHALELAYFHGLSQSEIAERLNEPLGTIKTRTRLALQRLRAILRQEDDR